MDSIEQLKEMIYESDRIAFFGGAGVSTASGIPDFRSSTGIFNKPSGGKYSPEEIVSHSFFMKHPKQFFDFHFNVLVHPEAEPNFCHRYLVKLEEKGKRVAIITQNIDGLHQRAGSKKVYELHGSVWTNHCLACGEEYTYPQLKVDKEGIPRCPKDQEIVRPDVVLYEEPLNQKVIEGTLRELQAADLLIVAGTSLLVQPAASLLQYYQGSYLAVINKTPIPLPRPDALVFQSSINEIFKQL